MSYWAFTTTLLASCATMAQDDYCAQQDSTVNKSSTLSPAHYEGTARMTKAHRATCALLCASLLATVAAHAQPTQPTPLTTEEVLALVKGKSLPTHNTQWGKVTLQFKDNGAVYGNHQGGSDAGKWRVEEGKLCLEWRKWDYTGCGVVQKSGGDIQHLWPNGGVHFTYSP